MLLFAEQLPEPYLYGVWKNSPSGSTEVEDLEVFLMLASLEALPLLALLLLQILLHHRAVPSPEGRPN